MGLVSSASAGPCLNPFQTGMFDESYNHLQFYATTEPVSNHTMYGIDSAEGINFTPNQTLEDMGYTYNCANFVCGYDIQDACPAQFPTLQWMEPFQTAFTGKLEKGFDLRTVAAVMGINMAITKLSDFTQTSSYFPQASGGIPGAFYYDPFFVGMEPFFCVNKQELSAQGFINLTHAQINGPELCFLIEQTKYYPLLYYPTSLAFSSNSSGTSTSHLLVVCDGLSIHQSIISTPFPLMIDINTTPSLCYSCLSLYPNRCPCTTLTALHPPP